jgi:hypothetical protein
LSQTVGSPAVPSAELARLAEHTTQLARAVREGEDAGVLEAARERVERAAVAVAARAPVLAGITRRLAEMLSNLGI